MIISWYSHFFTPEIGAPSARIDDLSRNWVRLGHQVRVNTCFPNHPLGKLYPGYKPGLYMNEKLNGIDVHRFWTYITPNKGFTKKLIGHISFLPSSLFVGQKHPFSTDIAIGTSPTFFAAMAAAAEGIRRNIPFIMEIRDLWPAIFVELGVLTNSFLIRMLELLELALYRQATRVVTVTESFRKNLIARGVPASKVVTIPNGADIEFWKPMKPPPDLHRQLELNNRFVVLYIGAHGISHALGKILKSARLLQRMPNIHFLFVGEGAEKEKLLLQIHQDRLPNVTFLDPVDKIRVREFYAAADVCLVPLRNIPLFDTFIPSKMFEIMAMGRPIIGSVRGEPAEIIKRSGGGIVVEPENSEEIAQAILHLYQNREKGGAMGEKGRVFVCKYYSRRALSDHYIQVAHEAIQVYRHNSS